MLQTNLSGILGKRRIKQLELVKKTGLSPTTVGSVYHDNWKHISRETIEKICAALEIDIVELFELVEDGN